MNHILIQVLPVEKLPNCWCVNTISFNDNFVDSAESVFATQLFSLTLARIYPHSRLLQCHRWSWNWIPDIATSMLTQSGTQSWSSGSRPIQRTHGCNLEHNTTSELVYVTRHTVNSFQLSRVSLWSNDHAGDRGTMQWHSPRRTAGTQRRSPQCRTNRTPLRRRTAEVRTGPSLQPKWMTASLTYSCHDSRC